MAHTTYSADLAGDTFPAGIDGQDVDGALAVAAVEELFSGAAVSWFGGLWRERDSDLGVAESGEYGGCGKDAAGAVEVRCKGGDEICEVRWLM